MFQKIRIFYIFMNSALKWEFEYFVEFLPAYLEDLNKGELWLEVVTTLFSEYHHRCNSLLLQPTPTFSRQPLNQLYSGTKRMLQITSTQSETNMNKVASVLEQIRVKKFELSNLIGQGKKEIEKIGVSLDAVEQEIVQTEKIIKQSEEALRNFIRCPCSDEKRSWRAQHDEKICEKKKSFFQHNLKDLINQKNQLLVLEQYKYTCINRDARRFIIAIDEAAEQIQNGLFLLEFSTFKRKIGGSPQFKDDISDFKDEELETLTKNAIDICEQYCRREIDNPSKVLEQFKEAQVCEQADQN